MMLRRGVRRTGAWVRGWRSRLAGRIGGLCRRLARTGRLDAWLARRPRRVAERREIPVRSLRWALSGLALSLVATCGQKGPLHLPEEEASGAALAGFALAPHRPVRGRAMMTGAQSREAPPLHGRT